MEQAEHVLLTERVLRVETDVTVLKTHQFEHKCQIEALAFEVHGLTAKVEEGFSYMERRFKQVDHKIELLSKDIKLVLEALAIKY